jgi:pilus assembly protein Flp/PilA
MSPFFPRGSYAETPFLPGGLFAPRRRPTAVEYAVMLALIIVVCITAISALGSNASNTFTYVGNVVGTTSS